MASLTVLFPFVSFLSAQPAKPAGQCRILIQTGARQCVPPGSQPTRGRLTPRPRRRFLNGLSLESLTSPLSAHRARRTSPEGRPSGTEAARTGGQLRSHSQQSLRKLLTAPPSHPFFFQHT